MRRLDHVLESGAGPGIEIEHQPVGALAVVDHAAARVHFQHAALHQRDQPVEMVERDDLLALFLHQMEKLGRDAGARVLLEEALPLGAFRAAHQRQHAAGDVRAHPFPGFFVVFRQHFLGDAGVAPINAVGMGEHDPAHHGAPPLATRGAPLRQRATLR